MSTENLRSWFWTIIKIFFYVMLIVVVFYVLIRFNLMPRPILLLLTGNRFLNLFYRAIVAVPCLLADTARAAAGGTGADGGGSMFTALLLLLLLLLLFLPCIIRYMYLRTPWGMSQLMKTTYKVKLENAKLIIKDIEENHEKTD